MRPYVVEHYTITEVPVTFEGSGDVAYVLDDTQTEVRVLEFDHLRDVLEYADEHDMIRVCDVSPLACLRSNPEEEEYTDSEYREHPDLVYHELHAQSGFTEREWAAVLLAMRKRWPHC